MMHAYPETYLNDAMNNLGNMFDYGLVDLHYDPERFYEQFLTSGVAKQFEQGNPKYVAGLSGPELAIEVIYRTEDHRPTQMPSEEIDKSPEYWAGSVSYTHLILSIPNLLLIIFLQAIMGRATIGSISIVIGLTSWFGIAKIIRTEVRQLRSSEYVIAAKCMGGSFWHILWKHLAPNFVSSIMFMVVMNVRSAIVAESTLSFLGIGLPLDVISWGSMLSLGRWNSRRRTP